MNEIIYLNKDPIKQQKNNKTKTKNTEFNK